MTSNKTKSLTKLTDDEIFKKPTKPAFRKKKILNEETYVKRVADIIEKDFFPDLDNLDDKLKYLEASESNDIVKLRELYLKYSEGTDTPILNPAESPATFETPLNKSSDESKTPSRNEEQLNQSLFEDSEKGKIKKSVSDDKILSLDQFMASYTSEDNESFEQVMIEQENKLKLKYPWLYESEEKHNASYTPNLALPSLEEQKQSRELALTGTVDKAKDTRPLSVENWNYKTFNSVMFVPDGVPLSKNSSIEKAKEKKREVCHENTRFTENPFKESLSQATMLEASAIQAYKREGKVGVDGKELRETPKVNGYSYVRSPSPAPGVDCSPMMTWGQIDGTPFQLDGSQTPLIKGKNSQGPSYKIPKVSDREELLIKLSEKVNQNNRERKSKALSAARSSFTSPSVRGGLDRLSSMSPAAQKLFSAKLRVNKSTDRALRASYTPSPLNRISTPTNLLNPSPSLTPKKSLKRPPTPGVDTPGLTDNLLNLPKRQPLQSPKFQSFQRKCAADFF